MIPKHNCKHKAIIGESISCPTINTITPMITDNNNGGRKFLIIDLYEIPRYMIRYTFSIRNEMKYDTTNDKATASGDLIITIKPIRVAIFNTTFNISSCNTLLLAPIALSDCHTILLNGTHR